MSRDASLTLLGAGRVGRLGFVADGEPFIVPMDYVFEEMCIYAHSLLGHKIRALRAQPRACFQVDKVGDDLHWFSVMAHGKYEEITDPGERLQAYRKLLLRFPGLTTVEVIGDHDPPHPDVILFRITVEAVTGVSSGSEL
jgi:nitroimidazol reductase NimA-like FMN-containing flavoprotein (pyridoxamine 5'-phosphate oxidase superfamily)